MWTACCLSIHAQESSHRALAIERDRVCAHNSASYLQSIAGQCVELGEEGLAWAKIHAEVVVCKCLYSPYCHAHTNAHACVCVAFFVRAFVLVCVRTCVCTFVKCVRTCIHTYACVCMYARARMSRAHCKVRAYFYDSDTRVIISSTCADSNSGFFTALVRRAAIPTGPGMLHFCGMSVLEGLTRAKGSARVQFPLLSVSRVPGVRHAGCATRQDNSRRVCTSWQS